MERKIEVSYLGYESEFKAPEPAPFGRNKWIKFDGSKIENKGELISTTFHVAIVTDGVVGKPFSYTVRY